MSKFQTLALVLCFYLAPMAAMDDLIKQLEQIQEVLTQQEKLTAATEKPNMTNAEILAYANQIIALSDQGLKTIECSEKNIAQIKDAQKK